MSEFDEPPVCWCVDVIAPTLNSAAFEDVLERHCAVVSSFLIPPDNRSRLQGVSETLLNKDILYSELSKAASLLDVTISNFTIIPMAARDWVADNLAEFPPILVGPYYMYGSHIEGAAPSGSIGIKLDAGPAFGTGEHATTQGCLTAFDRLAKQGNRYNRILDMGCGSGILSIAAAKTWRSKTIACDIDPGAVQVASDNARVNNVKPLILTQAGNGFETAMVKTEAPYDMIVSNILANPVCAMASELAKCLQPKGTVILSGFLTVDARRVTANYIQFGLVLKAQINVNGWVTLIFRKPT
jgi:ribosomal protein L11 methyltransferase